MDKEHRYNTTADKNRKVVRIITWVMLLSFIAGMFATALR